MDKCQISGFMARPDAVNVAHMVERSRVVGPGERFVIWVQGCPLECASCHNSHFRAFRDVAWLGINDLVRQICASQGIEGVTYTGGEPFAQAEALAALSRRLRRAGLTVMAYSGFTLSELESDVVPHATDLLDEIDVLLDGRYRQDQPTMKLWRGSGNQRLTALSPRYRKFVPLWEIPSGQEFEVRFLGNGEVEFLGMPPAEGNGH